jgi:DNA-binding GntR family transcriptional regulator
MTREDIWETFTVRAALESLAAGMAAEKITPEQIEELEALVEDMIKEAEAGDVLARAEINNRFHDKIIKISGHNLIIRLSNTLKFGSWSLTTGTLTSMNSVEIASRHKKIIDPLRRHDSEGASKAMREHIEHSAQSMLENWKDE